MYHPSLLFVAAVAVAPSHARHGQDGQEPEQDGQGEDRQEPEQEDHHGEDRQEPGEDRHGEDRQEPDHSQQEHRGVRWCSSASKAEKGLTEIPRICFKPRNLEAKNRMNQETREPGIEIHGKYRRQISFS